MMLRCLGREREDRAVAVTAARHGRAVKRAIHIDETGGRVRPVRASIEDADDGLLAVFGSMENTSLAPPKNGRLALYIATTRERTHALRFERKYRAAARRT